MSVLELISIEKIAVANWKTKRNFVISEQKNCTAESAIFLYDLSYATFTGVPPEMDAS